MRLWTGEGPRKKKPLIITLVIVGVLVLLSYFVPLPKRVDTTYYEKTAEDQGKTLELKGKIHHYLWGNKMDKFEGEATDLSADIVYQGVLCAFLDLDEGIDYVSGLYYDPAKNASLSFSTLVTEDRQHLVRFERVGDSYTANYYSQDASDSTSPDDLKQLFDPIIERN